MNEDYVGRQVVGIDLHRHRSVLVRMTESGERLGGVRINNDPYAFRSVLEDAGEHPEVVLEATYGWYWAADLLAELGAEVHLAHPLGVKGFAYRRVKNDFLDAADLADLLRMGRLPESWIAPPAGAGAAGAGPAPGEAGPSVHQSALPGPRGAGRARDHVAGQRLVRRPRRRSCCGKSSCRRRAGIGWTRCCS